MITEDQINLAVSEAEYYYITLVEAARLKMVDGCENVNSSDVNCLRNLIRAMYVQIAKGDYASDDTISIYNELTNQLSGSTGGNPLTNPNAQLPDQTVVIITTGNIDTSDFVRKTGNPQTVSSVVTFTQPLFVPAAITDDQAVNLGQINEFYVPYTGATGSVDIGTNMLISGQVVAQSVEEHTSVSITPFNVHIFDETSYSNLTKNKLSFNNGIYEQYIRPADAITASNNFYLPAKTNGSYTFATLDDIPSLTGYVPYTGAIADFTTKHKVSFESTVTSLTTHSFIDPGDGGYLWLIDEITGDVTEFQGNRIYDFNNGARIPYLKQGEAVPYTGATENVNIGTHDYIGNAFTATDGTQSSSLGPHSLNLDNGTIVYEGTGNGLNFHNAIASHYYNEDNSYGYLLSTQGTNLYILNNDNSAHVAFTPDGGITTTGDIILPNTTPTNPLQAIPKSYVDNNYVGNAPILGTIYNNSNFTSLTEFNQNGATASVSDGQISATSSANNFLNSLDLKPYTLLDTWTTTADIVAPTASPTTYGFGIGPRSSNADAQYYSVVAKIDLTNTANAGILSLYQTFGSGTLLASSTTKLTFSPEDILEISLYRNLMTYTARIVNKTNPQADVSVTYNVIGNGNSASWQLQNTGRFAMFIQTPIVINSFYVSSAVIKNSDGIIIGDSKDGGVNATTYANTYAGKLARNFNVINTGGGSDQSSDVLNRIPEIISLAPKVALLDIGSNDIRYGTTLSVTEANILSIYNQLVAAGIKTYILTGFYETNVNQTTLNTWKIATFGANVIDTYTPTAYDLGSLSGTTHPTSIGEDIAYRTIINANVFGTKKNDFQVSATDINANVNGTANQVLTTLDPYGFLTFSTPQDIATTSNPIFNSPIFQGTSTTIFTALSLKNNNSRGGNTRGIALDLYTPDLGSNQLGGRISSTPVGGSSTTGNYLIGSSAINGSLTQGWLLDAYGNFSVQQNATQPLSLFQVTQGVNGPGTITTTASGTTVSGVNTQFLNTFKVGQTITANGETHTISGIANQTTLTTDAWTNANPAISYTLVGGTRAQVFGNGNFQLPSYNTAGAVLYTSSLGLFQQTVQPSAGQILLATTATSWAPTTVSGDGTIGTTGVFTIGANKITYAKIQAMAANKLLGSGLSGTTVSEMTLGTGLSFTGSTLNSTVGTVTSVTSANTDISVATGTVTPVLTLNRAGNYTWSGTHSFNGGVTATQYKLSALNTPPSSSTDTGILGEIRVVAGFIYVCTAANTWVRTTLSTF